MATGDQFEYCKQRYCLATVVLDDGEVLSHAVYDREKKKLSPPMSEENVKRALRMLHAGWSVDFKLPAWDKS